MNASQLRLGGVERWLRRLLMRALCWALGVSKHATPLAAAQLRSLGRVAVLRLDNRLGNQVLQVPLLRTLRARLPEAELWAVSSRAGAPLLADCDAVSHTRIFDKFALGREGALGLVSWLRRERFDLIIDASNPTQPSLTHALIARLGGARYTLGSAARGFGPLRSLPSEIVSDGRHEVDLRLALLAPLGPGPCERHISLRPPTLAVSSDVHGFLAATLGLKLAVINIGARLREKQLGAADYAALANLTSAHGLVPVMVYGPKERALAEQAQALADGALLAPPSRVAELCALFDAAVLVLTADTGPMHLSVALGRPTCGLFVSTEPARYGHETPPHMAIDVRGQPRTIWTRQVRAFVVRTLAHVAAPAHAEHHARRSPPAVARWPRVSEISAAP